MKLKKNINFAALRRLLQRSRDAVARQRFLKRWRALVARRRHRGRHNKQDHRPVAAAAAANVVGKKPSVETNDYDDFLTIDFDQNYPIKADSATVVAYLRDVDLAYGNLRGDQLRAQNDNRKQTTLGVSTVSLDASLFQVENYSFDYDILEEIEDTDDFPSPSSSRKLQHTHIAPFSLIEESPPDPWGTQKYIQDTRSFNLATFRSRSFGEHSTTSDGSSTLYLQEESLIYGNFPNSFLSMADQNPSNLLLERTRKS